MHVRNSTRTLVCSESSLYELYLEASGAYVLQAEVNRSTSYTMVLQLSDAEVAQFERDGASFLRTLALQIDSFPESFRDRAL